MNLVFGNVKLIPLVATSNVRICDWGGSADNVMFSSAPKFDWWSRPVPDVEEAGVGQLSDSEGSMSSHKSTNSGGRGMLSSDSEEGGACQALLSASELLHTWGITVPAKDIPVLLLPEPIAFLIGHGEWTELMLQVSWHKLLHKVSGDADMSMLQPIFETVSWPTFESPVWKCSSVAYAVSEAEVPEMNYEENTTNNKENTINIHNMPLNI